MTASTSDPNATPAKRRRRFAVALSFPGEYRATIREIDAALRRRLLGEEIFFDERYEAEIVGFRADEKLQEIYHDQSELVVPFFCKEYQAKKWCFNVEWPAMRDALMDGRDVEILPLRFDRTEIKGLFSTTIAPDISTRSADSVAELIAKRLAIIRRGDGGGADPTLPRRP